MHMNLAAMTQIVTEGESEKLESKRECQNIDSSSIRPDASMLKADSVAEKIQEWRIVVRGVIAG